MVFFCSLEALAGRLAIDKSHEMKGEVMINGKPWTEDFNRVAGYVAANTQHIGNWKIDTRAKPC